MDYFLGMILADFFPNFLADFSRAALTDSAFSGGMCVGRLVSVVLARRVQPAVLVSVATAACLLVRDKIVVKLFCRFSKKNFFSSFYSIASKLYKN
jgi:hypothetical protein